MNSKKLTILTALLAALVLPLAASAATLYVPVVGTGAGLNGSQWQSEITFHNAGSRPIALQLVYRDAIGNVVTKPYEVAARRTVTIPDVLKSQFGVQARSGALDIIVPDTDARRLAITVRAVNVLQSGELGQDVPTLKTSDLAAAGDIVAINGPADVDNYRFNFGFYAIENTTVRWELVRADGTVAATADATYAAGTQRQFTQGVSTLFNAESKNNDVIHATIASGRAALYGSSINNASGDPSHVPALVTREDIRIQFSGIDLDENGTVDISDADRDGILDAPVDVWVGIGFPNYFRLVASGAAGEKVTLSVVSSPIDTLVLDELGTIMVAASGAARGTTGDLLVRATTATGENALLRIPVRIQ